MRSVGNLRVHFHAAVDRTGMHHRDVRLGQRQAFLGQAEQPEVFVFAGQQGALHAFPLQAQHDHDVHVPDAFFEIMEDVHAQARGIRRGQGARGHDAHLAGIEDVERMDLRARHARMQDVADDGDAQPAEIRALHAADSEHVQHGLRRMGMAAVAGVDDADVRGHVPGDEVGGTGLGVPHHEHVDVHGLQVAQGIEQRLALYRAGGVDIDVEHVGRQALGRQLEGGAGTGAGLEEQIDDGLAAQQRDLLDGLLGHARKGFGSVQNIRHQLAAEALDGQKVAQPALCVHLQVAGFHAGFCSSRVRGSGPVSLTCSPGPRSMRRPTTLASMGSSRPLRSTRTASTMVAGRP